jgi:hypothetical protein
MVTAIIPRTIAALKTPLCRCTGRLYGNSYAYRNGGLFDLRPLYMFYEPANSRGRGVPRFAKITDPALIAELQAIKTRMYGDL